MKKTKQLILIACAVIVLTVTVPIFALFANTSRPVSVTVNGQTISFPDQDAIVVGNRVMVPVRGVFEHLGFTATWNDELRIARLTRYDMTIVIPADVPAFTVNYERIIVPDVPQMIRNNRLMLPLRAITEAIGGTAEWDYTNRIAIIRGTGPQPTPQPTQAPAMPTPSPTSYPNPSPTASPPPTPYPYQTPPPPTQNPYHTPLPPSDFEPDPNNPNHIPFLSTTSQIQIPADRRLTNAERAEWIAEYNNNGGPSEFELEVIRLINEAREGQGLNPVEIDETMMHSARFYSQTMANLNLSLGQYVGPYGGAFETAAAFGARLLPWRGGNGNMGGWTARGVVTAWMNSATHRNFIMHESHLYIGFGSHLGGARGVFHFLFLSAHYSIPTT